MFACICRAVTSDQVSAAIDDGAGTLAAVARATRACTKCGLCRDRIAGMIAERRECPAHPAPAPLAAQTVLAGQAVQAA